MPVPFRSGAARVFAGCGGAVLLRAAKDILISGQPGADIMTSSSIKSSFVPAWYSLRAWILPGGDPLIHL